MKTNHVTPNTRVTATALLIHLMAFGALEAAGDQSASQPRHPQAGLPLDRVELLALQSIAERAESMLSIADAIPTRVWPHGVRDERGRQGIFIGSLRPLFEESLPRLVEARKAWVVVSLIAAVKYSEGSEVGHIAFTDANGLQGGKFYYDIDITHARAIHRDILIGALALDKAYEVIATKWEKVTAVQTLAVR
jgi:hypothetical protein